MAKIETVRLAELCDLVSEPVKPDTRHDALYLGLEHLAPGQLTPIGGGSASNVRSTSSAFQPGDVLYGKLRPYLDKAVLAEQAGICTTELLVLRAKQDADSRFLATLLHSPCFVEYAIAGTTGVQHPRTSWAHIREFEAPSLSPSDQRKIAEMLWLVHNAITNLERKRTVLGELFSTLLHNLTVGQISISDLNPPLPRQIESQANPAPNASAGAYAKSGTLLRKNDG